MFYQQLLIPLPALSEQQKIVSVEISIINMSGTLIRSAAHLQYSIQ